MKSFKNESLKLKKNLVRLKLVLVKNCVYKIMQHLLSFFLFSKLIFKNGEEVLGGCGPLTTVPCTCGIGTYFLYVALPYLFLVFLDRCTLDLVFSDCPRSERLSVWFITLTCNGSSGRHKKSLGANLVKF